ncbi:MAG TPA: D-alanyl-D-alanine carboxypeptidase family protein [Candidatus Binataceae bacterium]|nr:D-alanyl-D-alanine carboxypeptidase family protein [Candidatus Binataceae bacterium]
MLAIGLAPLSSAAASAHHRRRRTIRHARPRAHVALYRAELLEDAATGRILYEENGQLQWPPASMAKMMLLLVAEEQIKAGRFSVSDPVRISERSAHTGGSRLGLQEGQIYPLGELIKAALIKSANDAAVAIAEKIGGSVEATVRMMNRRARALGMNATEYHTVDGLPPRPTHDVDVTDARDLATVARALILETDLLKLSSQEECPFDGGVAMLHNTNHLVGHFDGCDGLKTGFTFEAGFNLTATAKRGKLRLISVILGAPSNQQRFAQSARLLEWGFERFTSVAVLRTGEPLPVHVQVASGPNIQPVAAHDLNVVLPKTDVGGIKLEYRVPTIVNGPLASGALLGTVVVQDRGDTLAEVNALCPIAVSTSAETPAAADNWDGTAPTAYNQENQ